MKTKAVPGTPNLLRLLNRKTILRLLEETGATSRTKLRDQSGLSLPTVSAVVKELLDEGWLEEVGGGISEGGKPPQLFQLNPDARYIVAVQMNHDRIRIRLTNLIGTVLSEEDMWVTESSPYELCAQMAKQITVMTHSLNKGSESQDVEEKLLGIGVAVPGVVDEMGRVSDAPEFGWEEEPIKAHLSSLLNANIVVENDVRLAVMGEGWRRRLLDETLVYVHLSYGIGTGILFKGELYRGAHFAAGEIGHFIVNPTSTKWCDLVPIEGHRPEGKKRPWSRQQGSFEAHYGLARLLKSKTEGNDEKQVEEEIITHIAYGITNITVLIDPDRIILGGEIPLLIPEFLKRLFNKLNPLVPFMPELDVSSNAKDAPLYGATRSVIENDEAWRGGCATRL